MGQQFIKNISQIIAVLLLSISCTSIRVVEGGRDSVNPDRAFIEYRVVRDSLRQKYSISYIDGDGSISSIDTLRTREYRWVIGPVGKGFKAGLYDEYGARLIISVKSAHSGMKIVSSGTGAVEYTME